jgi:predicted TIM-barrel fold metal-dependent hydrolase
MASDGESPKGVNEAVNKAFAAALAGGVVDTAVGVPKSREEMFAFYEFIRRGTHDSQSKEGSGGLEFPAGYMFKEAPKWEADDMTDPVDMLCAELEAVGIHHAIVNVDDEAAAEAVRQHPGRFSAQINVDPNEGMDAVRRIVRFNDEFGLKAVGAFPAGLTPQVPLNDKKFYPIYAKCVELGIPFCSTVGVPGPRIPFGVQDVALIDEICWFFPELTFVMRHGAEPWADLAVKLMLKWPNLYYSTTAFAPKYYPREIIEYANTRGADKIIWSGYFPAGLSYQRIFSELPDVPFRDHVWPKFLRENAARVFNLDI